MIKEGYEARRARLAEFEPLLNGGDPAGARLFFGTKAACADLPPGRQTLAAWSAPT